jgi:hypothetical protein
MTEVELAFLSYLCLAPIIAFVVVFVGFENPVTYQRDASMTVLGAFFISLLWLPVLVILVAVGVVALPVWLTHKAGERWGPNGGNGWIKG